MINIVYFLKCMLSVNLHFSYQTCSLNRYTQIFIFIFKVPYVYNFYIQEDTLRFILFTEENSWPDTSNTILWLSGEGCRVVCDFNVSRVTGGLNDAPGSMYISLNSRRIPSPPRHNVHFAAFHSGATKPIAQIPGSNVGVRCRKPGDEFPSPITSIFHTDRRSPSTNLTYFQPALDISPQNRLLTLCRAHPFRNRLPRRECGSSTLGAPTKMSSVPG